MKRLAALATMLAVMTANSAVLADFTDPAWYTGDSRDTAQVNTEGYSTVLIAKESDSDTVADNDIVYVNQADDPATGFVDAMVFLLKNNPEIGRYTVTLCKKNGEQTETYFYVGADSNNDNDIYMKRLQNEEPNGDPDESDTTWNIGYYAMVSADDYGDLNSLKVGYKDGATLSYGGFSLKEGTYPATSGDGDIYLIFQLNDVPAAYKDSAAVYLSQDSVSSSQ